MAQKVRGLKKTKRADRDLENIFDYIVKHFGLEKASKTLAWIEDEVAKSLLNNPEAGFLSSFENRKKPCRVYLLKKGRVVNVIVYKLTKEHIQIITIQDTRMRPLNMKKL